jgi:plasmid stability protein
MDTKIRDLDEQACRTLKERAALTGRTIGETMSEAIRAYLGRPGGGPKTGTLADLRPSAAYPEGNERLSEQVDAFDKGFEGLDGITVVAE